MAAESRCLLAEVLRFFVGVGLLGTCVLKVLSWPTPQTFLPLPLFVFLTVLECALAISMFVAWRHTWPMVAAILLAMGGVMVAMTISEPCGCLGLITLNRAQHYHLALGMGMISSLVLMLRSDRNRVARKG